MSISELQLQELFEAKELPDRRQSLRRIELEALLPDYAKRLRRRGVTAALLIRCIDHAHNLCEIRAVVVIWNIVILQLKIMGLSNKSNFNNFTPVRSTSSGGDFHF